MYGCNSERKSCNLSPLEGLILSDWFIYYHCSKRKGGSASLLEVERGLSFLDLQFKTPGPESRSIFTMEEIDLSVKCQGNTQ